MAGGSQLTQHVLKLNERVLAWTEAEKGRFRDEYFAPVQIPVVEHIPWAHKNLPIPPGLLDEVTKLFKEKIAVGMYECSDASYHSRWSCVKKKNGSLCLVHNLQPLNAVTISNLGIPPVLDQVIESMAGHSCYTILDLFVGYDHCTLDILSHDLTTIQSPVGCVRLTCLPQGWTGAVTIFHGNILFILEPEIPDTAVPFVDNTSIKGPATRYETEDGGYETIPANLQIRCFVWEHLNDVHRILHCFLCTSATVSAKKIAIAAWKSPSSGTSAIMKATFWTTPRSPRFATGLSVSPSPTFAPSSASQDTCAYGSKIIRPSPTR